MSDETEQRANDDMYFIKGMTDKQPEPSEQKRHAVLERLRASCPQEVKDEVDVIFDIVNENTRLREQNAQLTKELKEANSRTDTVCQQFDTVMKERDAAQQLSKDMFDLLYLVSDNWDSEEPMSYEIIQKVDAAIERFKSSK